MNNDTTRESTLQQAYEAWSRHAGLRGRRARYKNYAYGRQWDDPVEFDGKTMTEGQLARLSGKNPLTNNLIRQMIKTVTGRFRHLCAEAGDTGGVDAATRERNMLDELDSRLLEEFLISGCAIQRVTCERRPAGTGIWVDNVSPDSWFCNRFTDPRGNDLELAGMLHDMSLREVQMRFAPGSPERQRHLARVYREAVTPSWTVEAGTDSDPAFGRAAPGRCRVIEVWTLESRALLRCHDRSTAELFTVSPRERGAVEALNARRAAAGMAGVDTRDVTGLRWHCRWYAPCGELLAEHDSPYAHGGHPFCVKYYPLIDGEVHSFVEDVIDAQRHVNRLITMIDHVMGVSAKGVLLFPEAQKSESMSWHDVARRWANPNGVLPYRPDGSGEAPRQIINGATPAGACELLDLELKLMQQISGVSAALAGQDASGRDSAALYEARSRNSAIALLDIYESFNAYRASRNAMIRSMQE